LLGLKLYLGEGELQAFLAAKLVVGLAEDICCLVNVILPLKKGLCEVEEYELLCKGEFIV
jgi:hypothetical protein